MCFWDVRRMAGGTAQPVQRIQMDAQLVLKVAVAGAPFPNIAAVSTLAGEP